jgi:uroporphyrinogen-III synthase
MRSRKVAILESRLGKELVGLLERRGAAVVHAPALAELPDLDREAIRALVESLQSRPGKLYVFQTGSGTQALFAATDGLGLTPVFTALLHESTIAVRGPKPAAVLRARGVRIDCSAAEPYTTRELLACFTDVPLEKARVIVQRHGGANIELDRALEARGAQVSEVPTYRWSLPEDTRPLEELIAALERDEIDAVAFTNGEQARNLFAVAEKAKKEVALRAALNRTLVVSIGPVASGALREAGVKVGTEASPPKLGALLAALESALAKRAPG